MRRESLIPSSPPIMQHPDAPQSAPSIAASAWGERKFQRYVTPVALVYARLHRDFELDWWGQRLAAQQAVFFDQSCAETASIFTGRLVAGDELSRLWLYFVPEQGLASAMALQQAIRRDNSLDRLGMKMRVGVALGEANALTNSNLPEHDFAESENFDGAEPHFTSAPLLVENTWNSGCYGIEMAIRQAFRLCRVARMGEVLVSHDFMDALAGTDFYCAEQRIAGLDDDSARALVIESKLNHAFPDNRWNHDPIYDPMRDVRKPRDAKRNAA